MTVCMPKIIFNVSLFAKCCLSLSIISFSKKVEFKKVPNDRKIFEDLVGGELDYILYEAITIIARNHNWFEQF